MSFLECEPVLHDHNFVENARVVANDELAQIVDAAQPSWDERFGGESNDPKGGWSLWLQKVLLTLRLVSAQWR